MRGSVASYLLVAAAAAGSSALATWLGGGVVTPSAAQPAPATVQQILSQPLADLPGREVRISIVERAPGTASAPHRHPGHHTFGYVVEGTYEFAIDRQAPRLLKAGDTFYEPPGAVHSTSRNPSADQRVKNPGLHGRGPEEPDDRPEVGRDQRMSTSKRKQVDFGGCRPVI
jgi:quercetin dioxygenase-like cupin family protein